MFLKNTKFEHQVVKQSLHLLVLSEGKLLK